MGLWRWLTGGSDGLDCLRLEILMDYSDPMRAPGTEGVSGYAAVRWTHLVDDSSLPEPDVQEFFPMFLAALLYAKVLSFHKETRAELFNRIDQAAKELLLSEGTRALEFAPWNLPIRDPLGIVRDGSMPIWPWNIATFDEIEAGRPYAAVGCPKCYVSTLKVGERTRVHPGGFWIYLDMPMGQERILPPASALIALSALSSELRGELRQGLGLLLWYVNRHYGSPDRVSMASEAKAVAAAVEAIQGAGGVTMID